MKRWLLALIFFACFAGNAPAQNRVLELNGAGDFVELPSGVLSNLTTATVEFWVNWRTFGGEFKRAFNYGTPNRDLCLSERDGGALWMVFPEDQRTFHSIVTRTLVQTNAWYHLAGVIGEHGMKLYLNGWLVDSDPFTGGFDKMLPNALFRLGSTVTLRDAPTAFDGMIDEVRIWRGARTQQEIRENLHRRMSGSDPGLVALWNFDDETARDAGPNGWHGKFRGKARALESSIPEDIGTGQIFLDARVRNAKKQMADSAILEAFIGTNLVSARFSHGGVFKLILEAPNTPMMLRASTLFGGTTVSNLVVPAGEQRLLFIDLPTPATNAANTNVFAAAINNVLNADPATLERLDPTLLRQLSPLLRASEERILSLLESPNMNHRRFITMFLEKFDHSTLQMVAALAKARHDRDGAVRGFAQRSLQSLPVPPELEAIYTKRDLATAALFAGLLIPFALIHFFLFLLNPTKPSNLYYGLFAAAGALMIYLGVGDSDAAWAQITALAFLALGLLALYSMFYVHYPWTFWATLTIVAFAIGGLVIERTAIASFSSIQLESNSATAPFPFGVLAAIAGGYLGLAVVIMDMLRVVLRSVWRRQQGALLVGTGFLILIAAGLVRGALYLALFTGKISADTFAKYIIFFPGSGAAGFVICGSIYLAKSFSRTFGEVQAAKVEIEKKNAELTMARDVALTASQTKSQFLANMSHELRTPLNAIIGYSELMAEVAQEEGHKQYVADLEKVTSAAKHQLMLVNDILDLSKIEAGKTSIVVADFDVKTMIHEIRGVLAPIVAKCRNRLEIDCPGTFGKMRSDETKVRQVLFNLLSNAAKFTENGTITLRVYQPQMNGVAEIAFEVKDTGIGMTPEQVGRLFKPFTQAEQGIHQKYGGTGLGLVISKRFCEMLGGTLTVKSEFGKGSIFTATLPMQTAEVSP
jgi:signal transduction histidine kinase